MPIKYVKKTKAKKKKAPAKKRKTPAKKRKAPKRRRRRGQGLEGGGFFGDAWDWTKGAANTVVLNPVSKVAKWTGKKVDKNWGLLSKGLKTGSSALIAASPETFGLSGLVGMGLGAAAYGGDAAGLGKGGYIVDMIHGNRVHSYH